MHGHVNIKFCQQLTLIYRQNSYYDARNMNVTDILGQSVGPILKGEALQEEEPCGVQTRSLTLIHFHRLWAFIAFSNRL